MAHLRMIRGNDEPAAKAALAVGTRFPGRSAPYASESIDKFGNFSTLFVLVTDGEAQYGCEAGGG
jgi:hypothetical protein